LRPPLNNDIGVGDASHLEPLGHRITHGLAVPIAPILAYNTGGATAVSTHS
jgi:hypothetical protein